jgi:DNA-binding winged helix-turn-helix (wHTH) protein
MEKGRGIKDVRRRGFKLNEAFRIIGISESQGRQYVADKKIQVVRLGPRLPIVTDEEIDRILKEGID